MREIPRLDDISYVGREGLALPEHLGIELPGQDFFFSSIRLSLLSSQAIRGKADSLPPSAQARFVSGMADVIEALEPEFDFAVDWYTVEQRRVHHILYGYSTDETFLEHKEQSDRFYKELNIKRASLRENRRYKERNAHRRGEKPQGSVSLPKVKIAIASFTDERLANNALTAVIKEKKHGITPIPFGKADFQLKQRS